MGDVPVFWCEPTGRTEVSLRRYLWRESDPICRESPLGAVRARCAGRARIGETDVRWQRVNADGDFVDTAGDDPNRVDATGAVGRGKIRDDDPRWPHTCDRCGRVLPDTTARTVDSSRLYRAASPNASGVLQSPRFLAGAMFDAWWGPDSWRAADGIALTVILPDRTHWQVDDRWTRTGDPRNPSTLTVTPSIAVPGYHGWLTAGHLKEA